MNRPGDRQAGAPVVQGGAASVAMRRSFRAYASCIRYRDVIVLQGAPLMGVLFGGGPAAFNTPVRVASFTTASMLLVAHIFLVNDWAGVTADVRDPHKAGVVFRARGVSDRAVARFSVALLFLSLLIFAAVDVRTLGPAIGVAVLGAVYSHPMFNAKSRPVASSILHLVGGLLHFLLGYVLFATLDLRGIALSSFFALTFTAGHLNQEVRDYESDRANGLRTNAVTFGPRATFGAGFVLFVLAYGALALLTWRGLVLPAVGWLLIAVVPTHATFACVTLVRGLTFENLVRLQAGYRLLYLAIGATMFASLLTGGP